MINVIVTACSTGFGTGFPTRYDPLKGDLALENDNAAITGKEKSLGISNKKTLRFLPPEGFQI